MKNLLLHGCEPIAEAIDTFECFGTTSFQILFIQVLVAVLGFSDLKGFSAIKVDISDACGFNPLTFRFKLLNMK
jgi:hypothetical protein